MQMGVYEDFFDSVGVVSFIFIGGSKNWIIFIDGNKYDGLVDSGWFYKSRPQARTAAIEKANNLYNETN
jgi:hypothetical protein